MSGPLGSSQWMYNSSTGFYGTTIDQSVRFSDNHQLDRTATAGNQSTWTFSAWIKRCELGTIQNIWTPYYGGDGGNESVFRFDTADKINLYDSGANRGQVTTKAVFRDVGAWMHLVVVLDLTESTATDRLKIYVNGNLQEITTNNGIGTAVWGWNANNNLHRLGGYARNTSSNLVGYMAEINFVDGTALTPSTFGETKDGVWVPKEVSGVTYGTNGFRVDFADSSDLGNNANSTDGTNDFTTVTGLAATDVVPDSPTNNFCTLNSLAYTNGITLSEGNLTMATTTNNRGVHGTISIPSSGKWYWELHVDSRQTGGGIYAGFGSNASLGYDEVAQPKGIFVSLYNQAVDLDSSTQSSPYNSQGNDSVSNGDIFSFALDVDNQKFYIAKNGTYRGSSDPSAGTGGLDVSTVFTNAVTDLTVCLTRGGSYNETYSVNFGQDSKDVASANADSNGIGTFEHAVPSGFLSLCSSNLPEVTIGPNSDTTSDQHFGTLLYTGTGSTGLEVNGLSFTPDWLWIKRRDSAQNFSNAIIDSVRGNTKNLITNRTDAESTSTGTNDVQSFDSDGFTVGPSNQVSVNDSGGTFVAWCLKAGGAPTVDNSAGNGATPTPGSVKIDGSNLGSALAGSLAATRLSANTTAGFSIVIWDASGVSSGTVAHGLTVAPDIIIAKPRDFNGTNWFVQVPDVLANTNMLNLETAGASYNPGYNHFNDTVPTNEVFSFGGYMGGHSDGSGNDLKIAYCFHSSDVCKVGSYVGNGQNSPNGTFVFTGFRPAFVMVKDVTNSSSWVIIDNKRAESYNIDTTRLYANDSAAESATNTNRYMELFSNGFRLHGNNANSNANKWNENGDSYIYLAFAEVPFKYANAR